MDSNPIAGVDDTNTRHVRPLLNSLRKSASKRVRIPVGARRSQPWLPAYPGYDSRAAPAGIELRGKKRSPNGPDMSKHMVEYRCLLISPSDVDPERLAVVALRS